jgi:hypothetical protein
MIECGNVHGVYAPAFVTNEGMMIVKKTSNVVKKKE